MRPAERLERSLAARLSKVREQTYDLKRRELDDLMAQRLLAQEAAKRGISLVRGDAPIDGAPVRGAPEARVTLVSGLD